ncbi:hypothetical protein AB0M45_10655 [Nocardia sp. NPDC051787]|uniref:hypothetical protein n=1 Tax=Nocardia sp. NPDC051787 TaxID=3155415 RepID=UPI00341A46A9
MARDLKVELGELENVSRAWLTEVAPKLRQSAQSIEELKYTAVQFGPLFIGAWNAYNKAAIYIQERLNEAVPATEQIGNALHAAVVSFDAQQTEQEQGMHKLAGEMDFSI